jgi:adenosylhomocysteine nucleosidase
MRFRHIHERTAVPVRFSWAMSEIVAVILCALTTERDAMRTQLGTVHIVRHPAGTEFEVGPLRGTRRLVALAATGAGNSAAAVIAERAISFFRPGALLFVGIGGSLRPEVRLGDVVVGTRVYGYHGGRDDRYGFRASPRCWEAAHELVECARHVRFTAAPVHFGAVAAGEVVVDSTGSALADQLRRTYADAIVVDTESAGTASAGHLNRSLPTLTIRAVSDAANGTKAATDAMGWPAIAAGRAAAFAAGLLTSWTMSGPVASAPARA